MIALVTKFVVLNAGAAKSSNIKGVEKINEWVIHSQFKTFPNHLPASCRFCLFPIIVNVLILQTKKT